MAYLELQDVASYTVHEMLEAETSDHEDHLFSGIMFDVAVKNTLPVEYIELDAVHVRGDLGPMTVWMIRGSHAESFNQKELWDLVFEGDKAPSHDTLCPIELTKKIRIKPGERVGLYVHSKLQGDTAIVYDNERHQTSCEDRFIQILPGMAHISSTPFLQQDRMWGRYAWRPRREFVGKLSFGVRYVMWQPVNDTHLKFPRAFRRGAGTLVKCSYRPECGLNKLPEAVTFYILNMLPWNWFGELEEDEDTVVKTKDDLQEDSDNEGFGWRSGYHEILEQHQMRFGGVDMRRQWFFGNADDDDSSENDDVDDAAVQIIARAINGLRARFMVNGAHIDSDDDDDEDFEEGADEEENSSSSDEDENLEEDSGDEMVVDT